MKHILKLKNMTLDHKKQSKFKLYNKEIKFKTNKMEILLKRYNPKKYNRVLIIMSLINRYMMIFNKFNRKRLNINFSKKQL